MTEYQKLKDKKQEIRENKDNLIKEQLGSIKLDFIKIRKQNTDYKPLYLLDESGMNHTQKLQQELNLRLLYKNLSQVFNVQQANRDIIIHQIENLLKDDLTDLYLYRLDIKEFYESVDQEQLLKKITNKTTFLFDNLKLVENILKQYSKYNNNKTKGIPRGISISALLGEIYLQEFDHFIKDFSSTVYYARYVDDIFIITKDSDLDFKIKDHLTKLKLELNIDSEKYQKQLFNSNPTDFQKLDFKADNLHISLTYLGYTFTKTLILYNELCKPCEKPKKRIEFNITLSDKRFDKYKKKIDKCFTIYAKHNVAEISTDRQNQIKGVLKERLRYLFENKKITGYAKVIFTGAYYSNQYITITEKLVKLDKYIDKKLTDKNIIFKNFDKKFEHYYLNKNELKIWDLTKSKKQKKYEKICKIWK